MLRTAMGAEAKIVFDHFLLISQGNVGKSNYRSQLSYSYNANIMCMKKAIEICAFHVAALELWNVKLSATVRMSTSPASFKTHLKTNLFIAYYDCK